MNNNIKQAHTETTALQSAIMIFAVYLSSILLHKISVGAVDISTRNIPLTLENSLLLLNLPVALWHSLVCAILFFALFYNFLKKKNVAVGQMNTGKLVKVLFFSMFIMAVIYRVFYALQSGGRPFQTFGSYDAALLYSMKITLFQFVYDAAIAYVFYEIFKYFTKQSLVAAQENGKYTIRNTTAILVSLVMLICLLFMAKVSQYIDLALNARPAPIEWLGFLAIGLLFSFVIYGAVYFLVRKSRIKVQPWKAIIFTMLFTVSAAVGWLMVHQYIGTHENFPMQLSLSQLLSIILIPLITGICCSVALNITSMRSKQVR